MGKQVVLPAGLSLQHAEHAHSKDPWHQFEGLVAALIAIHLAAFAFWCYLLYASRARRTDASGGGGGGKAAGRAGGGGGGGGGGGAGAAGADWKSPREILRAYQKASLGKA